MRYLLTSAGIFVSYPFSVLLLPLWPTLPPCHPGLYWFKIFGTHPAMPAMPPSRRQLREGLPVMLCYKKPQGPSTYQNFGKMLQTLRQGKIGQVPECALRNCHGEQHQDTLAPLGHDSVRAELHRIRNWTRAGGLGPTFWAGGP